MNLFEEGGIMEPLGEKSTINYGDDAYGKEVVVSCYNALFGGTEANSPLPFKSSPLKGDDNKKRKIIDRPTSSNFGFEKKVSKKGKEDKMPKCFDRLYKN